MNPLPLLWAQTTTTNVNGLPADTPASATGTVMFLAVSAVIVVGAIILFFRYRTPAGQPPRTGVTPTRTEPTAEPTPDPGPRTDPTD
jgi:hypothetical protein